LNEIRNNVVGIEHADPKEIKFKLGDLEKEPGPDA
jgi:low affinity Fe/Cu permease